MISDQCSVSAWPPVHLHRWLSMIPDDMLLQRCTSQPNHSGVLSCECGRAHISNEIKYALSLARVADLDQLDGDLLQLVDLEIDVANITNATNNVSKPLYSVDLVVGVARVVDKGHAI